MSCFFHGIRPSGPTSPGFCLNTDRLVSLSDNQFCIASNESVELITAHLPLSGGELSKPCSVKVESVPLSCVQSQGEIQCLDVFKHDNDQINLAVIDSKGRILISETMDVESLTTKKRKMPHHISPIQTEELGYHGIAFNSSPDSFGTISYFSKNLNIYQNNQILWSAKLLHSPSTIQFLENQSTSLVSVCQSKYQTIYDIRSGKCVQMFECGAGNINSFDICGNVYVVGGSECSVSFGDIRNVPKYDVWKTNTKFDVLNVKLSRSNSNSCYVASLDHEMFCIDLDQVNAVRKFGQQKGFRGYSRWVGTDLHAKSDTWTGICDSGDIHIVKNPSLMHRS